MYPATSSCGLIHGNLHQILAVYHKAIKFWSQLKPADGAAYMKFYNFLLKCESVTLGKISMSSKSEMMCLVIPKLPEKTREKLNRNVMNVRRRL